MVRTSAFFGPWDIYNFVTLALKTLTTGGRFVASTDITVSPTYVPDLVNVCLDLLIDKEAGIWHLTNGEPITWLGLALKAAEKAGIDPGNLEGRTRDKLSYTAIRPFYSALSSERGILLPTLDDGLDRYIESRRTQATMELGQIKATL